jgi:hypothetical protein
VARFGLPSPEVTTLKSSSLSSTGIRRVPARRSRPTRLASLGVAGLAAVLLSGCQVDNTPKSYSDGNGVVRTNFLATCTGKIPNASTTVLLATDDVCGCTFDVFQNQVPYNDDDRARIGTAYPQDKPTFEQLEKELANEPSKINDLPSGVQDALGKCKPQSPPTTTAGVQSGPVAPGSTTTTAGTTPGSAPS